MKYLCLLFTFLAYADHPCSVLFSASFEYSRWLFASPLEQNPEYLRRKIRAYEGQERLAFLNEFEYKIHHNFQNAQLGLEDFLETIPEAERAAHLARFESEMIEEFTVMNDVIVEEVADLLSGIGVQIEIRSRTNIDMQSYKVLIISHNPNSNSSVNRNLRRYFARDSLDFIEMDLFTSAMRQNGGHYQRGTNGLFVGYRAIQGLLEDGSFLNFMLHELSHAYFEAQRINQASFSRFYRTSYKVMNPEGRLSSLPFQHYQQFYSSEELFAFSHAPYWEAERFRNFAIGNRNLISDNLSNIDEFFESQRLIYLHTQEIGQKVIAGLLRLDNQPLLGVFNLQFLNRRGLLASSIDELTYVRIVDTDHEIFIDSFVREDFRQSLWELAQINRELSERFRIRGEYSIADMENFTEEMAVERLIEFTSSQERERLRVLSSRFFDDQIVYHQDLVSRSSHLLSGLPRLRSEVANARSNLEALDLGSAESVAAMATELGELRTLFRQHASLADPRY